MSKILVTGGAGFIGSHLSERLLRLGHEIVILDDFNDYYAPAIKRRNLDSVRAAGKVDLVEGDIRDAALVRETFRTGRFDVLVHLAARAGVRPSLQDPVLYEEVNGRGTILLLEACREFGVRKILFASSSSVYGTTLRVPFREDDPAVTPESPYGATKRAGELYCWNWHKLHGITVACLRFFTVYGPRQRPDMAIHKFTRLIERGEEVPVFGDGSAQRDFTYYEDIVDGLVGCLQLESGYHIFNLGESRTIELREMIAVIERALGRKARLKHLPLQPGDVPITYADVSRARESLGYRPHWAFEDGIREWVKWYRDVQGLLP